MMTKHNVWEQKKKIPRKIIMSICIKKFGSKVMNITRGMDLRLIYAKVGGMIDREGG